MKLLFLLAASIPAFCQPAFVNSSAGEIASSVPANLVSAAQTTLAGESLAVIIRDSSGSCSAGGAVSVHSITDTAGDTFVAFSGNPVISSALGLCVFGYYVKNGVGAVNNQVTVQLYVSGGLYSFFDSIHIIRYSGTDTTNTLDASSLVVGTNAGASVTSASFTTANASEVVTCGDMATNGSTTFSSPSIAGATATLAAGSLNSSKYGEFMYNILSSVVTSQTGSFSMNTSGGGIVCFGFKGLNVTIPSMSLVH